MSFETLKFGNKLIIGFAIPVFLTIALSALIFFSLSKFEKVNENLSHTHEVIDYGLAIETAIIETEASLRKFLISGNKEFRSQFDQEAASFLELIEARQNLKLQNSEQRAMLTEIERSFQDWQNNYAMQAVALREEVNSSAEIDRKFKELTSRTVGKDIFDSFRGKIAELESLLARDEYAKENALVKAILMSMINQETGQRGFLLTGQEPSLEPYIQGKKDLKNHVTELSSLLDNRTNLSSRKAQAILREALKLGQDWASKAAQPEIDIRRTKNEYPNTIVDVANFMSIGKGESSVNKIRENVANFIDTENAISIALSEEAANLKGITRNIALSGALISTLLSCLVIFLLNRNIGKQLGTEPVTISKIANTIAAGDLTQDLKTEKPATGAYAALQEMQKQLRERIENDKKIQQETVRLKQALDNCSSAVIVTDNMKKVIYQNRESLILFQKYEPAIQSNLTGFSASEIIGHSLESLQKAMGLNSTHEYDYSQTIKLDVKISDLELRQVYSPIKNDSDELIGIVIEFRDRTDEVAVENELQSVVSSALSGDLTKRINMHDKTGFNALIGEQINALLQICNDVNSETLKVFSALSQCDLTASMSGQYEGSFAQLQKNANDTMQQLSKVIYEVQNNTSILDRTSLELSSLNTKTQHTAQTSAKQAGEVSVAAEQIRANINDVATASEEMSFSIREIAKNASEATRIANDAVSLASTTDATVRKLSSSSVDIGNVIKVINSIAEQTNLLALNATIEAARAGDAGKGFSVVANEVKDLAKETAKATEEIERKVATIQSDSESAVNAIGGIDKIIQEINEIQTTTAAAVEEQAATTSEIVRSVKEAALGSNEIANTIRDASEGAETTLSSTSSVQESTNELSEIVNGLRGLVSEFDLEANRKAA